MNKAFNDLLIEAQAYAVRHPSLPGFGSSLEDDPFLLLYKELKDQVDLQERLELYKITRLPFLVEIEPELMQLPKAKAKKEPDKVWEAHSIPKSCPYCKGSNIRIGNNFFAPKPPQGYAECLSCGKVTLIRPKILFNKKLDKFIELEEAARLAEEGKLSS